MGSTNISDAFASTLDWWREAGVDTLVAERPRDWLKPAAKEVPEPAAQAASAPAALPADLAALRAWLLTSDAVPGPPAQRLDSSGDPAAELMVLVDCPEPGDREAGALLGGEPGELFDRMLAAIGRERAAVYLAALSPARPASGRIEDDIRDILAPIAAHHVALAAPRFVLAMGEASSRALCGANLASARGRLHEINQDGASVIAVASFSPRTLLQRPAWKAESWKDLQLLMEGMNA